MNIKRFLIIILGSSIFMSCMPKNQHKKMLVLSIMQNDSIRRIKDFTICGDTNKLNIAVRIGIPKQINDKIPTKKIKKIIINYGYDTLVYAKGLDYMLSNPPDTNSFFLTDNNGTNLYGKAKDTLFWLYLLHNIEKENELITLKRFIKQTHSCSNF